MCGICGAISLDKKTIYKDYAKPMTDVLTHRGPDDAGYLFFHTGCRHSKDISFFEAFSDRRYSKDTLLPPIDSDEAKKELNSHDWDVFLGHRRLSILDLGQNAHQPMSDLSKNIWLSYNGEIYNFKEIRSELERLGHRFRSHSDTEVLLYAYVEWGMECIEKLNGMFAFAIYDNLKKKLYLCRDRYGIKPLYYTLTPSRTLIFASEIKSILEYKEYESNLDKEALIEYFTFQNIFTNKTLHKDVHILEPGHFLEIDLKSKDISKREYWDFDFSEPAGIKDEKEYIEELDRLFSQAVRRQLVSDVEVGTYLSGGLDSGSISAIASKEIENLKSFTIGFDLRSASGIELGFDEREVSEYLSYVFKTEHYEMVLKSGDMERCLSSFAYHLEEPRIGQSYPNYYAAKLAGKFVKVVLSGTGGDELFGGYPWRYYRAAGSRCFDEYIDSYYKFWQRLIPNKEIGGLFSPIADEVRNVWTRDIFVDVFRDRKKSVSSYEEYINHSLYFEAKTFLHGLLVVEDKLSMAHSLETRVPFLDNDLVDFAQKVPVSLKLKNMKDISRIDENETGAKQKKYFQKTNDGKNLLRKVASNYISSDITEGVKKGFSSPDASWFKGDSIELVKNKLLNKDAKIYDYMDYFETTRLINEHLEGRNNRRLFIWSLLNFEEWSNIYG